MPLMKKLLLSLAIVGLMAQGAAFAECPIKNCPKTNCEKPCEVKKECDAPCTKNFTDCDEQRFADIDCWYNNQYKDLKEELCNICPEAKCDLEENYQALRCCLKPLERRIDCERSKVCKMLEQDNECDKQALKDAKKAVKTTKKEMKKCVRTFKKDTRAVLCFKDRMTFNKFMRKEARKMRKLKKYCPKCDLPCLGCK